MTVPPMLSLFVGWFLASMNSACSNERDGDSGMGYLRRLSSGLLLGVVCTEIVPSTVLTIHEAEPVMVLAPILGIIISIIVVRGIDLLSTVQSSPLAPHKHKLSLHLDDSREENPLSTLSTPLLSAG
eukprot:CAMPEP_0170185876 /NCGR_PEP_ID=MMETSP0040_2-20121228/37720_1 /TAXON_ID=641309 /ORGANISM="Lotharella oceanica, Strain CCMP622" /LENGTH=126 /DNA_ID=CAMNT_0010432427 /DNA_START=38 /DNA_END=414 /DNA_ORIENTATION=-